MAAGRTQAEDILAPYRDRYFTEALAAVSKRGQSLAIRLTRLLYPATLADPATIAATNAAMDRDDLSEALRLVLLEQRAIVQQILRARTAVTSG